MIRTIRLDGVPNLRGTEVQIGVGEFIEVPPLPE